MFVISIFLVLISSYFILSTICKKPSAGFLYYMLIAFSQIVLSFEILSLFGLISKTAFFFFNILFMVLSIMLFKIKGKEPYKFNFDRNHIIKAIKRDKTLAFLGVCFVLFLILQLITALFFPVTFGDALTYYLTRCTEWIQSGSINHFITSDTRELVMPVNMELLYTWKLLFTKSESGIGLFSYISFVGLIYVVYNLLKELNFSARQRLWTIFTISSFALVAVEMYNPCADLFIGVLILSGIYLYIKSIKEEDNTALYFATLAFALSAGTKTTAIITIPAIFIVLLMISITLKKENLKKYLLNFCLLFIVNFIVFASYNYILNIIQFMNPISSPEQMELNKFRGGISGYLSNLIKYIFAFFDISGIKDIVNFNGFITYIQSLILSLFGLTDKSFTSNYFSRYFIFNENISLTQCLLGGLGIFIFIPSLIKSLKFGFKNKSTKRKIIGALSVCLIINILIFSRVMVFTGYNMRYILSFIIISTPICVYSYVQKRKFFKYFLCILMFIYLVGISHHKPVSLLFSYINHKKTNPSDEFVLIAKSDEQDINNYIKSKNKKNIALIIEQVRTPDFYIENLRLNGFKMDKILLENIEAYHLKQYDYIITNKETSSSTYIVNFEDRIKYPDLFVSKCIYYDYKQNEITQTEQEKPAMINCEVPYEYFNLKGFTPEYENNSYIVLSNTVK